MTGPADGAGGPLLPPEPEVQPMYPADMVDARVARLEEEVRRLGAALDAAVARIDALAADPAPEPDLYAEFLARLHDGDGPLDGPTGPPHGPSGNAG